MCSFFPENSSGDRTSISLPVRAMCARTSSMKARIGASERSAAWYREGGTARTSVVISRPSASHFARPPSRMRAFANPKSLKTQSVYVAHQLLLSP